MLLAFSEAYKQLVLHSLTHGGSLSHRVLRGHFGDDINRTTIDGSHLPHGGAPGHLLRLPAISAMIVGAAAVVLQTDRNQSVP